MGKEMNTSIPIRFGQITGNVTHCVDGIALPPLPFMRKEPERDAYQIRRIADRVAKRFKLTLENMRINRRVRDFAWPRHIAMYLLYVKTKANVDEVGRFFGFTRSGVYYSREVVERRMQTEPKTRALVESLIQELAQ